MFLKNIVLENIRCFERAAIDFEELAATDIERPNRKWTVLIGENGTGKSTLLKAVALIMAGSDALTELVGNPDAWISQGKDEGEICASIETLDGAERQLRLSFRRGEGLSAFLKRSSDGLSPLDSALGHADRNYPTFGFGASRRLTGQRSTDESGGPYRQSRSKRVASLFSREAELNPLESWAMNLDYQTDGQGLETVRRVLTDFLPEITFSHIDKRQRRLVFDTPDGEVPLAELSDGYQNVAAWVGDLLFRITETFEDYRDPLSVRGLLIIDEVDLHLHPKWQRRLLDFLDTRLPRMQLFVTTHSLVTAQQAPENALFYCIRRGDASPVVEQFQADPGKYLLHQLAATEAFGKLSDESLEVETLKDE